MKFVRLLFLVTCFVTALSARADTQPLTTGLSSSGTQQSAIEHLKEAGLGIPDKSNAGALGRWGVAAQPGVESPGLKLFWALGLCIGVLLIGAYFARRYLPGASVKHTRRLRIVDKLALTSKTSLLIVDVEGQKLLMTVGADRVTYVDQGQVLPPDEIYDRELGLVCKDDMKLSA